MGIPGIAVQPVDESNSESVVRFLIEWESDAEPEREGISPITQSRTARA
jgi:hypothetical protein